MILAKKALLLEKTLVAIKYNAKQLKKKIERKQIYTSKFYLIDYLNYYLQPV